MRKIQANPLTWVYDILDRQHSLLLLPTTLLLVDYFYINGQCSTDNGIVCKLLYIVLAKLVNTLLQLYIGRKLAGVRYKNIFIVGTFSLKRVIIDNFVCRFVANLDYY